MHSANYVDEVLARRGTHWAFDAASRVPIAGTLTVSVSNEKSQVDIFPLDKIVALRAMEVFPKYSPLLLGGAAPIGLEVGCFGISVLGS